MDSWACRQTGRRILRCSPPTTCVPPRAGSGTTCPKPRDDAEEPRASGRAADPAALRQTRPIPEPLPLQSHGPARVVALCNQKGGVGKTTSTINLGAALTEFGRRVLLVDFDPQGALSVGLGVQPHQLDRTVYDVLMESSITLDDVLLKTNVPGLDLVPSNIDLSAAEVQLVNEVAREQTLARALAPGPARLRPRPHRLPAPRSACSRSTRSPPPTRW